MGHKPHKLIRDKIFKRESQKQFWRVFLIESALFLPTSFISIVCAFNLNALVNQGKVYLPAVSLHDFFFSFLFFTFFILLFVLIKRANKFKKFIYRGLFILTVFWGGMTILSLTFPIFWAVLIMGALLVMWLEKPTVLGHDILIALGLSGAACFFGLGLKPEVVVALLLIFSFYDFIAVYKTKHMIKMAEDMIDKKVFLGFIVPKRLEHFKDGIEEIKPGGKLFILGGGDIVFPSLLAVSVVPYGFLRALVVIIFSLAGLLLSYWLFMKQENKEPIPALPPIALLAIIGYFATLLF